MKLIRALVNPWIVISLFFIILISGESIGGVYLFYLLLALPHGLIHSILGFAGVIFLLIGFYKIENHNLVRKSFLILGIAMMILSLYSFFNNDKQHYNYGSFQTPAFWITFSLFIVASTIVIAIDRPKRIRFK